MIKNRTIYIGVLFFFFVIFGNSHTKGQNITLVFQSDHLSEYEKSFADSLSVFKYLSDLLKSDEADGYFNAGYDSIVAQSKLIKAYYFRGDKYDWGDISFQVDHSLRSIIPTDKRIQRKAPSTESMQAYMQQIQSEFQMHGYAQCVVKTQALSLRNSQVFWEIHINPGNYYVLDSLIIETKYDFPSEIISYRSGLKRGTAFNLRRINELSLGIYDPQFVRQSDAMQINFSDSTYQIILNYKKNSNNMISGMIGIVPGNETQNLYLTGDAKFQLTNAFRSAENIGFDWAAYEPLSQRLKIHYEHPLIYNAMGIKSSFGLEKQDSSYLNVDFTGGIMALQYASELYVYYHYFSSSTIESSIDGQSISDLTHRKIGLNYLRQKLDFPKNPTKGYLINVSIAGGIKQNADDTTVPEGLGEFESQLAWYIPIGNRISFGLKNSAGLRYVKHGVSQNEMYRLGGIQSIRAYHERSIYASCYSFYTIEGIFFPDTYSSIYLFSDAGLFNQDLNLQINNDSILFSLGVGLRVNTQVGIMAISYGVPRNSIGGFDFRQSKIHIGYVNNF